MKIDISKINNKVVPRLEDCITDLQSVIDNAKTITISSSFEYYSYMVNLSTRVDNIKNNVKGVKDWAAGLEATYRQVDLKNQQLFNNINMKISSKSNNAKLSLKESSKNKTANSQFTDLFGIINSVINGVKDVTNKIVQLVIANNLKSVFGIHIEPSEISTVKEINRDTYEKLNMGDIHIAVGSGGYKLENTEDESDKYENGGSHAMYIKGISEDGNKLVVSSWGKQYFLDVSEDTIKENDGFVVLTTIRYYN